jgi:hypothetical protein
MADATTSRYESNYIKIAMVVLRVSPRAVRVQFDKEFHPDCLKKSLKSEWCRLSDVFDFTKSTRNHVVDSAITYKNWIWQNKNNNLPVLGNNKFHWGCVIRFFIWRSERRPHSLFNVFCKQMGWNSLSNCFSDGGIFLLSYYFLRKEHSTIMLEPKQFINHHIFCFFLQNGRGNNIQTW